MAGSILNDIKQVLGIDANYTAFDVDIIMHINTVFSTLNQLGIGPDAGFMIEDASATWDQFVGADPRLNSVRTYTYLRIRLLFDPPEGSYHLVNSMNQQVTELEWRLNVKREGDSWVPPTPPSTAEPEVIVVPVNDAWYRE